MLREALEFLHYFHNNKIKSQKGQFFIWTLVDGALEHLRCFWKCSKMEKIGDKIIFLSVCKKISFHYKLPQVWIANPNTIGL